MRGFILHLRWILFLFLFFGSQSRSSTFVVTTAADTIDGNITSARALQQDPGPDGISLREAIYAANNTGADKMFNLYGFSEDLSAETEIFSTVQNRSIPDTGTSCLKKTIDIPATTISSGSFYIAVEWVTKPLSSVSGSNSFFLCTDSHLDYTNTNFIRFTGTTWSSTESISATAGDLGILVNY